MKFLRNRNKKKSIRFGPTQLQYALRSNSRNVNKKKNFQNVVPQFKLGTCI